MVTKINTFLSANPNKFFNHCCIRPLQKGYSDKVIFILFRYHLYRKPAQTAGQRKKLLAMTIQILKAITAGILAGIALFLVPFILLRILVILLIIRLIFRLFGGGRRWKRSGHFYPAFARRWQHMSDDEKKSFREKMQNDFFNKMDN